MVEEISKNIQTMKRDILRLKEEGSLLPREEIERQKKVEDAKRIKIEMEIKRTEEDERKKEEQELLRIRKEERKINLDSENETKKEVEEIKKPEEKPEEINKEILLPPQPKEVEKPAEPTKEDFLKEIAGFQEEKNKISLELKGVLEKKHPMETQKNIILSELSEVRKSFQIVVLREKEIENTQKDLEEKEILAQTLKDRTRIEKERWAIEEKRREIEQKRWPWDEKIKALDEKIKKIEEESLSLSSFEMSLKNKLEKITNQEENVQKEIKKIELKEELKKVREVKVNIEKENSEAELKLGEIGSQLQTILNKEKDIEENKAEVELKEDQETDLIKKRELETERWSIGEKRRQIETERWKIDEVKSGLEARIEKIKERMTLISEKEKSLMQEIAPKEIQEPTVESSVPVSLPAEAPAGEKEGETVDRDSDLEQAKRRIEMLRKSKIPAEEEKPEPVPINPEPKKEVPNLKELERQRLIEQEERRKELLGRLKSPLEVQSRDNVLPKPKDFVKQLPKKPSGTEKIWLRILIVGFIVIVLTAILTFWYWYFNVKNAPEPVVENQIEITPPVEETIEEIKTFAELDYLFDSEIRVVITEENIKDSLIKILQEDQIDDKFIRVIFEGLGLKEFNDSLLMTMPEDFYNKVENDFILFVYSQPQGKRLGIITKTSDSAGLKDVLKLQETIMETNLKALFELSGQTKPAIVSYFRNASDASGYDGPNFRYKTVNKEDVGICYGLLNDYFILSSSWKSTETLLNKLK